MKCIYLKNKKQQKVNISKPGELHIQIKRQEGDDVIFGCLDFIFLRKRRGT